MSTLPMLKVEGFAAALVIVPAFLSTSVQIRSDHDSALNHPSTSKGIPSQSINLSYPIELMPGMLVFLARRCM